MLIFVGEKCQTDINQRYWFTDVTKEHIKRGKMSQEPPRNDDSAMDVDVDDEDVFNDNVDGTEGLENTNAQDKGETNKSAGTLPKVVVPELPEFTRKDKTLHELLEMMEDYYPIVCVD